MRDSERGFDGDFWDEKPKGRAVYSSDDGYVSDLPPKTYRTEKPAFSASASFGASKGSAKQSASGAKSYTVGMKVRHPKFGTGTVISLKNGGAVVNVAFDNQGIKELSASLAPLEILR